MDSMIMCPWLCHFAQSYILQYHMMVHIYEPLKNGFAWGPESREGKYIPEYMSIRIRMSVVEGSDIITLSPSDVVGQLKG